MRGASSPLPGPCPRVHSYIVTKPGEIMGSDTLAEFELLVMLAALRLGPERAYTVTIAEDIRLRTGRTVRRANVFNVLGRLEEKGLVSTRIGEPRPERGGRPPRLVSVTAEGAAVLRATTGAIVAMIGDLPIAGPAGAAEAGG